MLHFPLFLVPKPQCPHTILMLNCDPIYMVNHTLDRTRASIFKALHILFLLTDHRLNWLWKASCRVSKNFVNIANDPLHSFYYVISCQQGRVFKNLYWPLGSNQADIKSLPRMYSIKQNWRPMTHAISSYNMDRIIFKQHP